MLKKIFTIILVISITLCFFNVTICFAEEITLDPPPVESESAILMDAVTGQVLYAKNEHVKKFPASITKIMTSILALEKGGLENVFTADKETINIEAGSSNASIQLGEELTIEQLLYFTLVVSGNDAANALGQYVSGDLETFGELMTQRAKELGCLNTFFWNANGLNYEPASEDKHMTTAYDMALIMKRALEIPKFVEIIGTAYYEAQPTNKFDRVRKYTNSNKLIQKNSSEYYEYCVGGKTGWTTPAGNTLVTYAEKGDRKLICVVLKANGSAKAYKDTRNLFDYGFNEEIFKYTSLDTLPVQEKSVEVYEKEEAIGKARVSVNTDVKIYLPAAMSESKLDIELVCPDKINVGEDISANANVKFPEDITFKNFEPDAIPLSVSIGSVQYYPAKTTEKPTATSEKNLNEQTVNNEGSSAVLTVLLVLFAVIIIVIVVLRIRKLRRIKKRKYYNWRNLI